MKAMLMYSFGGPGVLTVEDVPTPSFGPDEILIRVLAASVNPIDYKIRSGSFNLSAQRPPMILGRDVSGVVDQVGCNVKHLKRGDDVFAMLGAHSGGYAELAVAKIEEVALKPQFLDHVHAAAVPLASLTAWQALFDQGNLVAGQRVLIHGAGGGVGHFAVQFAKVRDATVFATGNREDLNLLRELGADEVIDYQRESFETKARDIDLVIDLVGGETQIRSWAVLREGGTLVSTLQEPSVIQASKRRAHGRFFMVEPKAEQLREIAGLINDQKVMVIVSKTMPLDEAGRAQDELEHEHSRGKLVLTVE